MKINNHRKPDLQEVVASFALFLLAPTMGTGIYKMIEPKLARERKWYKFQITRPEP